MSWSLYLARKQLWPTGKRFGSFFFILSVLGVALGVMVLVVVQSVMGGFGQEHRARAISISGHLDLNMGGRPFQFTSALDRALGEDERVTHHGPYAHGFVLAQHGAAWVGTMAFGIDAARPEAYGLAGFLTQGSVDSLGDDAVILSQPMMWQLGVGIGDEIEVFTPKMIEGLQAEEVILPRSLEVVGVYRVDWDPEFIPGLLVTARTMQDFYGLEGAVHGVTVRLVDGAEEGLVAAEYNDGLLPFPLRAQTWEVRWAQLLSVLAMEKVMILFVMLPVVLIAVFSIAIGQVVNVVRRTREIGALLAFGANPRALWLMFCFQGFVIGLAGFVLGSLGAVGVLSVRGPIIRGLVEVTGSRDLLTQFYFFTQLPVHYAASDFIVIGACVVGLAVLAGVLPAWRATRLRPAEAIRAEV
jgi:lipoprotein-releasing system permease protein